ncbi:sensor histidine kinase [Nonomuraea jiangxiensis]|uniref:Anti-sigma regulatory factor (Ser/Thr protein kinase) n=1 Tax=Nonomuraea jiangxiensis TaxID=633440 RepID=A0A1G9J2M5_9ACTN|nr:sensor histidine kinase [Nonomuraea jiangxiensis]SDL31709.1 Anti-sigma regulatory factor (Ser/Thr protein kinase) [Nonomuraea jiangxiensis]
MRQVSDEGAHQLIHQALLYDGDHECLSATTDFCLDGLAAGDKVLVVVAEAKIALLREKLAEPASEVEFVAAREWYRAPGRTLAALDRHIAAHKSNHGRVRIIGEPVWDSRTQLEECEWIRCESVTNAAFASRPAWFVCLYDRRTLPEHILTGAGRTHPHLLTGSGGRDSDSYVDPALFACPGDEFPLPPAPANTTVIAFGADLGLMRQRLVAHIAALGLPGERAQDILLAVNEVATNSVEHGAGHGLVTLWTSGTTLVCDIVDSGRMTVPLPGFLPPALTAGHGHGLWIARQLCELVQVRADPDGTQIRLHLAMT